MRIALGDVGPEIADTAIVLPTATVIGDVEIRAYANLWYGCVVRGDEARISVGEHTNLQDGVIVHADPDFPATIGPRVTVGHGAIIHGSTIEADCLIGMRAVVLNGASVGAGSLVAAGAVIREGMVVPPGSLVAGVPAKVRRDVSDAERKRIEDSWRGYVDRAVRHHAALEAP
jgi:carbonic anhydrase/acetyltransferase-like protein (isoleucine patch superfamily)